MKEKIESRVSAEGGDISSPASVINSIKDCVLGYRLSQVATYGFIERGGIV